MEPVVILSTGVANTASVAAAIRRCGFDTLLTKDPTMVNDAERVILPGVGSFESGMQWLNTAGLTDAIRDRVNEQRPLLAICLGLQLLCKNSEESPGIPGLGIIDTQVRRLPQNVRVPQFGWNRVHANTNSLVTSGYAYYANSYCVTHIPQNWNAATTTHGVRFAAAMQRGTLLACQFHPELSGQWGRTLINSWLINAKEGAPC